MNNVVLIGRLTRDPETRITQSGKTVTNYTLAVDRYGEGADFIRCVAFGKAGEFAEKYLAKGKKIAVRGSIHTDSYTNNSGEKRNTFEVYVDNQEFAEKKAETPEDFNDPFVEVPEEKVPFR